MNILLIGCSISTGCFKYADEFLKYKKQDYCTEYGKEVHIIKSPTWYCFLNNPHRYKIEAHCFGACGYSTYAQFLYSLEKTGKIKNFDRIIIQESWEPRTAFMPSSIFEEGYNMEHNYIQKSFEYNELIKINVWWTHPDNNILNLKYSLGLDNTKHITSYLHDWILEKSIEKVKEIIERNNLKCTVISMSENFLKTENNITNIGFNFLYGKLREKNIITNEIGHLTLKGNQLLAEWLNEYKILENI